MGLCNEMKMESALIARLLSDQSCILGGIVLYALTLAQLVKV